MYLTDMSSVPNKKCLRISSIPHISFVPNEKHVRNNSIHTTLESLNAYHIPKIWTNSKKIDKMEFHTQSSRV